MTTRHVVPRNDLIEHDADDECVCQPTTIPSAEDDGRIGWVVVHHSLDGREANEEADR